MAKKSRRNRAKRQANVKKLEKVGIAPVGSTKSSTESAIVTTPVIAKTSAAQMSQYRYVINDLRNIGIIAGALIIILIILTFILG